MRRSRLSWKYLQKQYAVASVMKSLDILKTDFSRQAKSEEKIGNSMIIFE